MAIIVCLTVKLIFIMNIKDIITVTMTLFAVIDIIGSLPVILDIRKKTGSIHPEKATLVSLLLMIGFLFVGQEILSFIGIDINSFAIAGGLVLFLIALEMILGIKFFKDEHPEATSIVPIAFPLIAGAGTMTTLLSLRSQYDMPTIVTGIVLNLALVYLSLRNLGLLERLLGSTGQAIIRKTFGFILLAIAVKILKINFVL